MTTTSTRLSDRELFVIERRRRRITQGALAKVTSLSQSRISHWEIGALELPEAQVHELWAALQ